MIAYISVHSSLEMGDDESGKLLIEFLDDAGKVTETISLRKYMQLDKIELKKGSIRITCNNIDKK